MFSKMLIFIMCFIGLFTLMISLFPAGFFTISEVESSAGYNPAVADRLELANVTIYDRMGNDNMTYPYTSLTDHPDAPQFNVTGISDVYLEVWWSEEILGPLPGYPFLEFRKAEEEWWGFAFERMVIYTADGNPISSCSTCSLQRLGIRRQNLLDEWNAEYNASRFSTKTPITANYLITYNETTYSDIGAAWDAGDLGVTLTWEWNATVTSFTAVGLLGQLLTFQTPDLGFEDTTLNLIFNALIAIPIWVMVAILIIKLVTSVLPTAPGVQE